MTVTGVIAPSLQIGSTPAARVLDAVRTGGPVTRDQVVAATGLSAATVHRQVTALLELGVLVERPDLAPSGGIGRPRNPLLLDLDHFCVAGIHIGAQRTLLTIADLAGRPLHSHAVLTPVEDHPAGHRRVVDRICELLAELAGRFSGRRLLWGGAAIGGVVADDGIIDHPILGWRRQPLGELLHRSLGVPVSVSEHVQAMAAAELLMSVPRPAGGSGLFFYARETVGMALTVDGRVHLPRRGAGTIAGLPVQAPQLTGRAVAPLQEAIGSAVLEAAAARLQTGTAGLLDERSKVLGEVVAMLADALNPDTVTVAGDGFTGHPRGLAPVQAAFDAAGLRSRPLELAPSRFGVHVQESAAIAVALGHVYLDPVAAVMS